MMHDAKGLVYVRGHGSTLNEYTWSSYPTSQVMPAEPVIKFRQATLAELNLRKQEQEADAAASRDKDMSLNVAAEAQHIAEVAAAAAASFSRPPMGDRKARYQWAAAQTISLITAENAVSANGRAATALATAQDRDAAAALVAAGIVAADSKTMNDCKRRAGECISVTAPLPHPTTTTTTTITTHDRRCHHHHLPHCVCVCVHS